MSAPVGLWIDHRKAVIAVITNNEPEIKLVTSQVEKQPRRSGDSPLKGAYESQQVAADDSQQRKLTADLDTYYDAVIQTIGEAESILIFGPGEAKDELKKRLQNGALGNHIVGVEAADKMTDRQVAAKVRKHFEH